MTDPMIKCGCNPTDPCDACIEASFDPMITATNTLEASPKPSATPLADIAVFQQRSARLVLMLIDAIKMGPVTLKQSPSDPTQP